MFSNVKKDIMFERYFESKTNLSKKLDDNIKFIKSILEGSNDIVYREFKIGGLDGRRAFLFYIDGMADKILLDNFVITPLMLTARIVKPDYEEIKNRLLEAAQFTAISSSDFKEIKTIEEAIIAALSGDSALIIDESDSAFSISSRAWPTRGISEPSSETVIRGSRDGFTETIRMNTALVRRRIRDPRFKVCQKHIGTRSKTDIAIMYIDDIVDKKILDELNKRLDNINIDSVIDSGYVQQFIEDRAFTFLPEVQATERPDTVAASIYEGRVAILVDNSPQALIIPVTIQSFLQSPEDYYMKPVIATFTRILRSFAAIVSVISPAFYIAVTSYHQDMIPNKLAISIAASREGVPFPAYMETLIMIVILELLLEAGIRLPRPIGSTIGIVGGLIIGQAAVAAGIVSPIMIIVVALTAVASFAIPNYDFAAAARIMRLIFILGASIFGLYGIMLAYIGIMIHMVNLKSFGVPYLAPFAPFEKEDMKDSLFYRGPWKHMIKRPIQLNPNDLIRQGGENNDK